jgi:iron(III) transport system permease protein
MRGRFLPWGLITVVCLAVLSLFILYPLATLTLNSFSSPGTAGFSLDGFRTFFSSTEYLVALRNTIVLGCVVTLLATLVGVPFAYVVARFDFPLKSLVAILPLSTIIIPEIISAQSWLLVLGNNGLLTNLFYGFGIELPSFYGWGGLIIVMTLTYYTYVYFGVLAALRGFDGQLEEAALSLGASPLAARLKVMLPTMVPAILVNALVVFTLVVGNFALATMLGHNVPLMSVLTYGTFVNEMGGNPTMQSTLSVISIALVGFVLFVQKRYVERKLVHMTQGRAPAAQPVRAGAAVGLGVGVVTLLVLSLLPLAAVFIGAFTRSRGPVMRWGEFSLGSMERAWLNAPEPVLNSLKFASMATVIGVVVAVTVSYLIVKKKSLLTQVLDYVVVLPLAISGTILGIAIVQTFNSGWLVLTGGSAIMVLLYVVRRAPFSVRNASSMLFNIPDSIEEASISLGVSPLATFFKVVLPVMKASVISAAIMMWVTTIAELSGSIVVYGGGLETMPIKIFRLVDTGHMGLASAYGATLVSMILMPVLLAVKVFKVRLFSGK